MNSKRYLLQLRLIMVRFAVITTRLVCLAVYPLSSALMVREWVSISPVRITASPADTCDQYDSIGRLAAIAVHSSNSHNIYAESEGQLGQESCSVWKAFVTAYVPTSIPHPEGT